MTGLFKVIALAWLIVLSASVAGEEAFPAPLLQVQDAIDMALTANQNYLNLMDQAELAALDYESARSVYRTKFASSLTSDARSGADVGSTYSLYLNKKNQSGSKYSAGYYNYSFGNRTLSELRFTYTLPFFRNPLDSNKLAIDQAEINLARSRRLIEIGTEELVNEVVSGYYRLAMAIKSTELARDRLSNIESLHEAQSIRQGNGEISELELTQSALRVTDARQHYQLSVFEQQQLEDAFKLLLGSAMHERLEIDPDVLVIVDDQLLAQPLSELEQFASTNRIELVAKREELLMAHKRIKSVSVGGLPPVEVSLQYALVGEEDNLGDSFKFDDQRFGVGLKMNTDLGLSEKRLKQRKLYLKYQARQREYQHLQNRIKMDVRSAYFRARQADNQLDYALKSLDLEEQKQQQSEILHQNGEMTRLEMLESNHRLADARYKTLSAKVNYLLAEQALAMASGRNGQRWQH